MYGYADLSLKNTRGTVKRLDIPTFEDKFGTVSSKSQGFCMW